MGLQSFYHINLEWNNGMKDTPELLVVFACDLETDDPEQGWPYFSSRWDRPKPLFKWKSMEEGMPLILGAASQLEDSYGAFKMTFFVRADEQMRAVTGSACYMFERYADLFSSLDKSRFELGWHPHTYRWIDRLGSWSTELSDKEWIRKTLTETGAEVRKLHPEIICSRMDGIYDNSIMASLDASGIRIDSSAYPGVRELAFNNFRNSFLRGIKINACFDWIGTPDHPYHPAQDDYRVPGTSSIWELPLTCYTARHPVFPKPYFTKWKFFSRYEGQTAHLRSLYEKIRQSGQTQFLVTSQHASDIVRGFVGKVFRNSAENIILNAEELRTLSAEYGIPFRFIHFKDALSYLEKSAEGAHSGKEESHAS